jgi:outer membrane protein TolC
MKNMVRFETEQAILKLRTRQVSVDIYRNSIIPQAQKTLESSRTNYQTGKTDFLMLLDSYRMLLMAKEDYYMNVAELYKSYAQLERAVGVERL